MNHFVRTCENQYRFFYVTLKWSHVICKLISVDIFMYILALTAAIYIFCAKEIHLYMKFSQFVQWDTCPSEFYYCFHNILSWTTIHFFIIRFFFFFYFMHKQKNYGMQENNLFVVYLLDSSINNDVVDCKCDKKCCPSKH